MDLISETQDLIGALNNKRGALTERLAVNKATRQNLALEAHLGNKKAAKTIADLHEESRRLSDEFVNLDAAILTANQRHDEARKAQDDENRKGQARKCVLLARELEEVGRELDLGLTNARLKALENCVRRVNAAGMSFASYPAYEMAISAAIRVLLRDTIWMRRFEAVPSSQHRTFAALTSDWALNIKKKATAVLGADVNKVAA